MKNNDYNLTFLDEAQLDNDYRNNFNNESNHEINEDHKNDISDFQNPVDVKIIVNGTKDSEFLSKAIKDMDIEYEFNIVFSSIILTNNVKIAKNAIHGADIVLIAMDPDEDEKRFFSFYNVVKNNFNQVIAFKFPKTKDFEVTAIETVENEIKNSIIKIGLSSILNFVNTNNIKYSLNNLDEKYKESLKDNEKLSVENDVVRAEARKLKKENNNLVEEIKRLQNNIDEINLEFTDFKSRFSNIYSKDLLEMFELATLWEELFDENLENQDEIIIATNKFKPSNIVIGQGIIGANSKDEAVEWLKIVKTALIFINENFNELRNDFKDEKINSYNLDKGFNNDKFMINGQKKDNESKNSDYEQFQNFWD